MYKRKDEQFGAYNKITFFNESSGNGFSVVPEVGGTILELWFDHQQIIDGCLTPEALGDNQAYKSSLLFPFPNRLEDGHYELNGKEYEFPINDVSTNNALHGFGREVPMDILQAEVAASEASIVLSYFDEGGEASYPFPFLLDVTFSISEATGFKVQMKFTNEANHNIPVGIGWHPYFKISDSVNTCSLEMPPCKMIEIDERMIPTGVLLDYDYFKTTRLINQAVLDNAFKLETTDEQVEVMLSNGETSFQYWQETGKGKFNFLQVYTPPSRDAIAIEPMTCNIDAFNNGDGLLLLKPESFVEASCGIRKQ